MILFDSAARETQTFSRQERIGFVLVGTFLVYTVLGATAMLTRVLQEPQASVWLLSWLSCAPLCVYGACRLLPVESAPGLRSTSYASVTPQEGNRAREHSAGVPGAPGRAA